ncbi:MAG: hypothetical protein ACXW31_04050, partial [Thermoanaerobaculia bacterium]
LIRYLLVMSQRAAARPQATIARTIRIPVALRKRIAADAERCGRSFEGQVIALLRRHYGEDVDIAPGPAGILALALASLADVPASELDLLTRKLRGNRKSESMDGEPVVLDTDTLSELSPGATDEGIRHRSSAP